MQHEAALRKKQTANAAKLQTEQQGTDEQQQALRVIQQKSRTMLRGRRQTVHANALQHRSATTFEMGSRGTSLPSGGGSSNHCMELAKRVASSPNLAPDVVAPKASFKMAA